MIYLVEYSAEHILSVRVCINHTLPDTVTHKYNLYIEQRTLNISKDIKIDIKMV